MSTPTVFAQEQGLGGLGVGVPGQKVAEDLLLATGQAGQGRHRHGRRGIAGHADSGVPGEVF
jgi:hypothetical protein